MQDNDFQKKKNIKGSKQVILREAERIKRALLWKKQLFIDLAAQ